MVRPCHACGAASAVPVCEACGAVRPAGEAEREGYFALFNLPEAYAVDRPALEKAYLTLSRNLHPDRHRASPALPAIRRLAAFANEGYAVLRDGVRRAEYLLARRGVAPAALPPGFLEEQLALREMAAAGGAAAAALRDDVRARSAAREAGLAASLSGGDPDWNAARRCLDELKYWRALARMLEHA